MTADSLLWFAVSARKHRGWRRAPGP
jgi:hypothetical protein